MHGEGQIEFQPLEGLTVRDGAWVRDFTHSLVGYPADFLTARPLPLVAAQRLLQCRYRASKTA